MIAVLFILWLAFASSKPGESSAATSILPIPRIKITHALCTSRSSMTVSWHAKKNVDGYIIYVRDKKGEILFRKKVEGADSAKCDINELSYNTVYRFSIAGYRMRRGGLEKGEYDKMGYRTKIKVTPRYENGYKYFYDWDGNHLTDVTEFLGDNPRYQIRVNTEACVTTVYAEDGDKGFTIPVRAWLCSPSTSNTLPGIWSLGDKYRYRPLFYGTNSQWAVRIHDEILFHTTPYLVYGTNNSLDVAEYNKLGTPASHGCIRMQCEALIWITNRCSPETQVVIYQDKDPGGFGKPILEPLPEWHTWDPTDPTAKDYCEQHGCHADEQ